MAEEESLLTHIQYYKVLPNIKNRAIMWTGGNLDELKLLAKTNVEETAHGIFINEGTQKVQAMHGDFIIESIVGTFKVVKPAEFFATYNLVGH